MDPFAVVFRGVGKVELAPITVGELRDDEVLVETITTGISQGTDRAMVRGSYRGVHERYPFIYGYLRVGKVVELGRGVSRVRHGDRVFSGLSGCRLDPDDGYGEAGGAYTSHGILHESDLVRVPDDVSDGLAAMCGLAAIAYEGVRLARVEPRQRVVVVGLGTIGQFSAMFSVLAGAEVAAIDLIEGRRELASNLFGVTAFDPNGAQLIDALAGWAPTTARPWRGRSGPPISTYEQLRWQQAAGPVDVVIDTTGNAGLVRDYVSMLTREGGLCLQGYYGGDIAFDHHAAHMKRLSIHCPGGMDLYDYELALNVTRRWRELEKLVQLRIPVRQAPADLMHLLDNPAQAVGAVIDWT